jgi:hypothetical protein
MREQNEKGHRVFVSQMHLMPMCVCSTTQHNTPIKLHVPDIQRPLTHHYATRSTRVTILSDNDAQILPLARGNNNDADAN